MDALQHSLLLRAAPPHVYRESNRLSDDREAATCLLGGEGAWRLRVCVAPGSTPRGRGATHVAVLDMHTPRHVAVRRYRVRLYLRHRGLLSDGARPAAWGGGGGWRRCAAAQRLAGLHTFMPATNTCDEDLSMISKARVGVLSCSGSGSGSGSAASA